jgi:hypothetical protein
LIPWTRELAQLPTPTMAILIFLISKWLKVKGYLIQMIRSKTQVRPFYDTLCLPVALKYIKRGMCPKSRPLARTDIRGKVTGIPGARKALARR